MTDEEERASARVLTPGERRLLSIVEGVSVRVAVRSMLTGPQSAHQPVEAATIGAITLA